MQQITHPVQFQDNDQSLKTKKMNENLPLTTMQLVGLHLVLFALVNVESPDSSTHTIKFIFPQNDNSFHPVTILSDSCYFVNSFSSR